MLTGKETARSFDEVFKKAIDEYEAVSARTQAFDEELKKEALVYGEEYYDILCVAYRESMLPISLLRWTARSDFSPRNVTATAASVRWM